MEVAPMRGNKAALQARMEKLKRQIKAIEDKEKQEADRKALLAGRSALRIAEQNPGFAATLRAGLDADLSGQKERALFDFDSEGSNATA
jgi:hypothetical protein